MEKITKLRLQRFWNGLRPTWSWGSVLVWSTLFVPVALVIFLGFETAITLVSFALFLLTITVLDMKKDRDSWKRSCEMNKDLLEEERKKVEGNGMSEAAQ